MALSGTGVLAIWNGIAPQAEAEFLAWHVGEHIPERVAVPGFLRGRRYVAEAGTPRYFNFYETITPDALTAPVYLERLNSPSEWTRAVVRHFTDTHRTICRVAASLGTGDGGHVGTVRLSRAAGTTAPIDLLEATLAQPGIVAVHLLEGQRGAGGHSAEKALRDRPDEEADAILLVEATDAGPLDAAFAGPASRAALAAHGFAHDDAQRGIYRLQYALGRDQVR